MSSLLSIGFTCIILQSVWPLVAAQVDSWLHTDAFPESIYYFSRELCLSREVREKCKALRSTSEAVTILSRAENNAIVYKLYPHQSAARHRPETGRFWIGLHRTRGKHIRFRWDSLPLNYTNFTNWVKDRPGNVVHAIMDFSVGRWDGTRHLNSEMNPYICEDVNPCTGRCRGSNAMCVVDKTTGDANDDCACSPGFRGSECDRPIPCHSNPCVNGGTCAETDDQRAYVCSCPEEYIGSRCEDDFNECFASNFADYCSPFGTENCRNKFGSHVCECRDGFSGRRCDRGEGVSDDVAFSCLTTPCQNDGTCVNGKNYWVI